MESPDEDSEREGRSRRGEHSSRRRESEDSDPFDRPAQRKRKKPARSSGLGIVWIVLGSLGALGLLICGGGVGLYYLFQPKPIPQSAWQAFSPAGGDYSVSIPGTPVLDNSIMGGLSGSKYIIKRPADQLEFMVAHIDIPNLPPSPDTLLALHQAERDNLLRAIKGTLLLEKDITLGSTPGKEFQCVAPDKSILVMRIYLAKRPTGSRVYLLMAGGSRAKVEGADGKQFFDSFRFLNDTVGNLGPAKKPTPEAPLPGQPEPIKNPVFVSFTPYIPGTEWKRLPSTGRSAT